MKLFEEELTEKVIGAAIEVHRELGPGLLESAYEFCLCQELKLKGMEFKRQVSLPVEYKGIKLDAGYRVDLIAEDKVLVELKTVEKIAPVHEVQLRTYLKLTGIKVGLLLNFYVPVMKDGIKRVVL